MPQQLSTKSPATNPPVHPSPSNPGSTIRKAFLLEAIANLFTIPLITHTRWTLSLLLLHPTRDINPTSIFFAQLFGGLVVGGLTSALLAGATNSRNGVESRRVTYLMLGLGEVVLIPMLVAEMVGEGEKAVSGLVAGVSITCLVPPLAWRLFVLGLRPELLGRYRDVEGDGDAKGAERTGDGYGAVNQRED